ncbi:MAG: hypothetical protein IJZ36_02580 [Bacilli bacterium]|nr:hypothetical protein [Bacilli bacterium]
MKKTINLSNQITRQEKNLIKLGFISLAIVFLIEIFCHANVSSLSLKVEKIKSNITNQEKKIESLNMKVSELTSFDNVKEIVKSEGLTYNNNNIININGD